jgi:predicted NUDIX family phosphoesterase
MDERGKKLILMIVVVVDDDVVVALRLTMQTRMRLFERYMK